VETIGQRTAPAYEGVVLELVLRLAVLLVLLGLVVWDIRRERRRRAYPLRLPGLAVRVVNAQNSHLPPQEERAKAF
jgi:hypothetical protein